MNEILFGKLARSLGLLLTHTAQVRSPVTVRGSDGVSHDSRENEPAKTIACRLSKMNQNHTKYHYDRMSTRERYYYMLYTFPGAVHTGDLVTVTTESGTIGPLEVGNVFTYETHIEARVRSL